VAIDFREQVQDGSAEQHQKNREESHRQLMAGNLDVRRNLPSRSPLYLMRSTAWLKLLKVKLQITPKA